MNAVSDKIKEAVFKRMERDRQRLLMRQPFIGMILMNLALMPMPEGTIGTACTDGQEILMDMGFYARLELNERLFVMAHEAWHCVLMHGMRCQTRDHELFNIAADLEIHFILKQDNFREPFVLPHDPKWEGLSAEEIYEKLLFRQKRRISSLDTGKESSHLKRGPNGQGFDEHVYAGNEKTVSNVTWNANAVETIRRIVIRAAHLFERSQGTLPGNVQGIVEKLRKPELSWQELLRQYLTRCYGGTRQWLSPERRHVYRKLFLPSYRDNRLNAVMSIDTSGSTEYDLPQFFAELSSLLNTFGKYDLTVIQCDSIIQHVETFSDAKHFPKGYQWKSFGHGGTSFEPPFTYVQEHRLRPDVFIYLTDGYGMAPERPPRYPVIWVLTRDGQSPAKWGRSIKLKHGCHDSQS